MAPKVTLQLKRDTEANVLAGTMAAGEPGFCTDTGALFIYNGSAKVLVGKAICDTFANRGNYTVSPGRLFFATDTSAIYIYNGSSWQGLSSGGVICNTTTIDFGATPVSEASFTVTDANVSASSKVTGEIAYVAPTGKDLDELEMDAIDLKFGPGSGQFTVYAKGLEGYLADKFVISYQVG